MSRFLLIRLSSIGDIVLTTAVIRCLKSQIPEAEIYFLTKERFKPLLKNNPYLSGVIGWQDNISDMLETVRKLNPDFLIDLHVNLRTLLLKIGSGKKGYSIQKMNFRRWKMVSMNKRESLPHINERYFSALKKFGVTYDGRGLDYFIPEYKIQNRNICGIKLPEIFDAWMIGATHFTKRLPEEKILEGIRLRNKMVVLLGGETEKEIGERIAHNLPELVKTLCGKTDFDETAAVLWHADLVLTNDTGFMHVAAALKKKIVSFWGGTVPELGMSPLLPEGSTPAILVENNTILCRPCSKIGKAACPLGHFSCMKEIDLNRIQDC